MGGIVDFRARFYSPYLNQFTQPDTIVSDPYNPQAWNRYAYVLRNPIRYNDPTGHRSECSDGPRTWAACDKQLNDFALKTLKNLGGVNDLEAMADIVEKAADLYGTYEDMIPVLSGVFIGIEESNSLTVLHALRADPCAALGREIADCRSNTIQFWDRGFNEDYRDGHNQFFHFWAYFATSANIEGKGPAGYIPGRVIGNAANEYHERWEPLFKYDPQATWQDYALSRIAINLGTMVNMGAIRPNRLGDAFREYLGADGPGTPYVDFFIKIAPLEGNRK